MNFLESICVRNGRAQRAELHWQRMHRSIAGTPPVPDMQAFDTLFASIEPHPIEDISYKLRIIYNAQGIEECSARPYVPKKVTTLQFHSIDNQFNYSLKYADRSEFETISQLYPSFVEPILIQDGEITDTTFSNLCFLDAQDGLWYTPRKTLLAGTMRQYLLHNDLCIEKAIYTSEIHDFSHVALINAMLPLGTLMLHTTAIL